VWSRRIHETSIWQKCVFFSFALSLISSRLLVSIWGKFGRRCATIGWQGRLVDQCGCDTSGRSSSIFHATIAFDWFLAFYWLKWVIQICQSNKCVIHTSAPQQFELSEPAFLLTVPDLDMSRMSHATMISIGCDSYMAFLLNGHLWLTSKRIWCRSQYVVNPQQTNVPSVPVFVVAAALLRLSCNNKCSGVASFYCRSRPSQN
jgi:hypothetical protein